MFAELPFSHPWRDLFHRVEQLDGSRITSFTGEDGDTWLLFDYHDFEFGMHDRDAAIQFTVNAKDCPEALLNNVLHHFSEFLSPDMSD
ncbi:hypothetical protein [Lacipirellula sp.]|uniref:hypothetical protein n=1 Tax=Lacipirellula sp. TaxID=2691419 RepID=UPI003D109729